MIFIFSHDSRLIQNITKIAFDTESAFPEAWMTSMSRARVPLDVEEDLPGKTARVHRAVLLGTAGLLGPATAVEGESAAPPIDALRSTNVMCLLALSADGGDLAASLGALETSTVATVACWFWAEEDAVAPEALLD